MKVFNTLIPSMYVWTIFLISLLAAFESYLYRQVPLNLLVSVAVAAAVDMLLKKFYLKTELKIPYSAIISGLIIGSVAPINSPLLLGAVAAVVAILSKIFIRIKGSHIFNPATLGLLISLFLFSQGDQWWAANGYNFLGYIIPLSLVLVISNYKARKLFVSAPFLLTTLVLGLAITTASHFQITAFTIVSSLLQLNFFLAFIMVSEPKTSPFMKKEQIVFGAGVGALTFAFGFLGFGYTLLMSLLLGNLCFALWKIYSGRMKKGQVSESTAASSSIQTS